MTARLNVRSDDVKVEDVMVGCAMAREGQPVEGPAQGATKHRVCLSQPLYSPAGCESPGAVAGTLLGQKRIAGSCDPGGVGRSLEARHGLPGPASPSPERGITTAYREAFSESRKPRSQKENTPCV